MKTGVRPSWSVKEMVSNLNKEVGKIIFSFVQNTFFVIKMSSRKIDCQEGGLPLPSRENDQIGHLPVYRDDGT